MSWQDLLGVRWSWQPRRSVRVVVATSVTVVVVASLLLVLVGLCLTIGFGWTAILFLWIAEKWWIVFDPDNLLLWLKLLPGIWRWVHEDDPVAPDSDAEKVRHSAFTPETRPPRRW